MNDNQKSIIIGILIVLIIGWSYYSNNMQNQEEDSAPAIENISQATDNEFEKTNKDTKEDDVSEINDNYEETNTKSSEKDDTADLYDDLQQEHIKNEKPANKQYHDIHIDEKINKMFPNNYLSRILTNGDLVRWHHESFPLKVYVKPISALPPYYKTEVEEAFKDWQKQAGDLISFKFVYNEKDADIRCYFPNDFDSRIRKNTRIAGETVPNISQKKLNYVTIEFANNINHKYIPAQILRTIAIHEIGHALGLNGHSEMESDVMYPQSVKPTKISSADLNTLRLLYSIIPDVCNKEYDSSYRDKFWTTDDILGEKNKRIDMEIQSLTDDMKVTKTITNGKMSSIAYQYYQKKDYNKAIEYWQKSLAVTESKDKNAIAEISYCIAVCYVELKDYNSALKYADYYAYTETDPSRLAFIGEIYKQTNNINKAKSILIPLLNKSPKTFNAYITLGKIYLKENNQTEFMKLADKAKSYFPDKPPIWYEK